jgi:hypothetical protein
VQVRTDELIYGRRLASRATMRGYLFVAVGAQLPGSFPVGSGVVTTFDTNAAHFGPFMERRDTAAVTPRSAPARPG